MPSASRLLSVLCLALGKLVVCRVPDRMHSTDFQTLDKQPVSDNDFSSLMKALVWFWIIDETQSTNLYAKCVKIR